MTQRVQFGDIMVGMGLAPTLFNAVWLLSLVFLVLAPIGIVIRGVIFFGTLAVVGGMLLILVAIWLLNLVLILAVPCISYARPFFTSLRNMFLSEYSWSYRRRFFLMPIVNGCLYAFAISLVLRFFVGVIFIASERYDLSVIVVISRTCIEYHCFMLVMSVPLAVKMLELHEKP